MARFSRISTLVLFFLVVFLARSGAGNSRPVVDNLDRPYRIENGLWGRKIALWHSHGLFYDQRDDRWKWQRARVMSVVEDKYTMSYVLPYLLPMLQRAGADVFMPRERDMQPREYIVDNDPSEFTSGRYAGSGGKFQSGGSAGFALKRQEYTDRQNPFADGTYRRCEASRQGAAQVLWQPAIAESGWYWVSVAYTSTSQSVPDAQYAVHHAGGVTRFAVDQRKGGGTWIYLGRFYFEAGADASRASVVLTNRSNHSGVVTADAVRWGGGMGSIARRPAAGAEMACYEGEVPKTDIIQCYEKEAYTTSGQPRAWEASRYYLQWAGAPFDVYSPSQSLNDYRDDYNCRPMWVNWLMYGSRLAPDSAGLAIDLDAAFAFHSDAGTAVDSIIGTMALYSTRGDDRVRTYPNGKSRMAAERMARTVTDQVVTDIRATHCARWTSRDIFDKRYAETRRANVPTMILELLSHQNYDDMVYGLDPTFRFTVSRAVYKGLARFIAAESGRECVIAPLPVSDFGISLSPTADSLVLSWSATADTLEPTVQSEAYVLYSSVDGHGWDNGVPVHDTCMAVPYRKGVTMHYKVTAVNSGGESMDSRVLAAYRAADAKGCVLIVDGFDRVAAPQGFSAGNVAGFPSWLDHGVPAATDIAFVGRQMDFDRSHPWVSDDHAGWGQSMSNFDFNPPAGNNGSHILVHGQAIAAAGYSWIATSHEAFASALVDTPTFQFIDIVLGEQRATIAGPDSNLVRYTTFPPQLRRAITDYTAAGGNILVSGAYVASDAWTGVAASDEYRRFIENTLRVQWRSDRAAQNGRLNAAAMPKAYLRGNWQFCQQLNDSVYEVESPDAIIPARPDAYTVLQYSQNTNSAAVICTANGYTSAVCGFPLETVADTPRRNELFRQLIALLTKCPISEKVQKTAL